MFLLLNIKDSPSGKLLFAKDIPQYRQWLMQFYSHIRQMPPVTDDEISVVMNEHSKVSLFHCFCYLFKIC